MDEIRIRELPQKGSAISLSDLIIIEDEDGTKTIESSAFKSLIQQSLFFDTVEDMKSATLHENDIVRTLGYRNINDGGGAYYLITYSPTDVEDGIYIHYLHTSDTLRAHYIRDTSDINISQAGAYGDGVNDDFTIIQRMLNKGTMVAVPRKTYKVSGSLDVLSNTTIDLNGATIICNSAAAFTIGLDHEAKNITIKNGKFVGINGIELYTMASEITISNCEFYGSDDIVMSKAILINGASNVQIDNIKVGSLGKGEVRYGIYVSNGTGEDNEAHLNYNIQMSNLSIISSMAGINFSGTYIDKNISVVDFSIEGFYRDRTDKEMYGVIVGSNSDSISLSNGKIKNMSTAIVVTGIISAVVGLTDIMADDCDIMYNFASAGSTVHIYGLHRFTGNGYNTAYVFDRITSKIVMQGEFDADRESSKMERYIKTSLVGELVDVVSPIGRNKINVLSIDQLNNDSVTSSIPGYKNISLNLQFSGSITDLKFPSLSGQIVALYSDADGCVLTASTKIRVPSDITLSRFEPVVLRNNAGVWNMVQFGGSSDGTTGGGSGGGVIGTLDPLTIYLGDGTVNKTTYDGSTSKEVQITPSSIGAATKNHKHAVNEISGIPTYTKLPNPNKLIISVNGGETLGEDKFEYDGSEEITVNISGGSGGGSVDLSAYAKKKNLTGTGSISINRKEGTETGTNSVAMGTDNEASKDSSVAMGYLTKATGKYAAAWGNNNTASGEGSTATGLGNEAIGAYSEASGKATSAVGEVSFTMGTGTKAKGNNQFVFGRYNKEDENFVNIVGGGSADSVRSNIYTLDWNGNAVYTGTVTASEPTDDNHLTTKHYVDNTNKNLDNKITDVLTTIGTLSTIVQGFQSGTKITDWNNIKNNGFICTDAYTYDDDESEIPILNCPSSCEGERMIGISMLSFSEEQTYDGDSEIVISGGFVFAFSIDSQFDYNDDNTMCIPMYVRAYIGPDDGWDDWVKLSVGSGDYI